MDFRKHLIYEEESVREALSKLNALAADAILFVIDHNGRLIGSLTDGDIRRGFLKGLSFDSSLLQFIQPNPTLIKKNAYSFQDIEGYRRRNLKIIPIVDEENIIVDILNVRTKISLLPLDAVVMAGGRGERLMPLTENCPKPLLKVGEKPIIEHNIDRLINYGIDNIIITIRYLGHQIKAFLGNGEAKDINIQYVEEEVPLGTFGALSLVEEFRTEHILLMNSDILTNIDFADFYKSFLESGADLIVASLSYQVKIPYAVLEISNGEILSLAEKPTYNYYSNGGIYLFKRSLLNYLEKGASIDATDFMQLLIDNKAKVVHYPILGYWLDIGRHEDLEKAQKDIKHITL
ncbi:CBS domain-containing protein [Chitinophaga rupis]|uniref:CBS domain-containing protein n=1 Tax=Chitinophaga rupis TaxID=573321 RepID=A0A1H7LN31_9BACT|nr:nucleotidyltransferase family protein [Chitinophaga rupis]SEL00320.1 CBS domain-containing protein [Chitinophaga rupis]